MEIPWGQIFLWLHITIVTACAVRVLYKQHNIGTAFAWLIVLFVFPILGAGLYLLIGEPRLGTARAKRTVEMNRFYRDFAERYLADSQLQMSREMANRYHGISRMAAQSTGLAATNSNAMTLLNSTDSIVDAILADINQAQQSCLLAFYIIEPQGKIETLLDAVVA